MSVLRHERSPVNTIGNNYCMCALHLLHLLDSCWHGIPIDPHTQKVKILKSLFVWRYLRMGANVCASQCAHSAEQTQLPPTTGEEDASSISSSLEAYEAIRSAVQAITVATNVQGRPASSQGTTRSSSNQKNHSNHQSSKSERGMKGSRVRAAHSVHANNAALHQSESSTLLSLVASPPPHHAQPPAVTAPTTPWQPQAGAPVQLPRGGTPRRGRSWGSKASEDALRVWLESQTASHSNSGDAT